MAAEYETENCVRGYHEYQAIGTSAGETLLSAREPTNVNDRCAVLHIIFHKSQHY